MWACISNRVRGAPLEGPLGVGLKRPARIVKSYLGILPCPPAPDPAPVCVEGGGGELCVCVCVCVCVF